jgi:hypothetical protein
MALASMKHPHLRKRSTIMSAISVDDLPRDFTLDRQAMACIRGGGGPATWLYGWIVPFVETRPSMGPVVNFYEVNNTFNAQQMINQFQSVDVNNAGSNSNITVSPGERSENHAG